MYKFCLNIFLKELDQSRKSLSSKTTGKQHTQTGENHARVHTTALVELKNELYEFTVKLCSGFQSISEMLARVLENQKIGCQENLSKFETDVISLVVMDSVEKLEKVEKLLKSANIREAFVSYFICISDLLI